MRNLKKFLALMLAMVMAMSLMITANATSTAEDFADGAGITPEFAEAVDILSGMRVFSGDNGNFKPAANITRAEMAAVIYRLVSGDVTDAKAGLYANYAPFKDVSADKWYAGYVGYCWNMGLIKGRDSANTVFDPTGNVTGYEALAMLLRAVGYDKNNEFTGSTWQTNVSTTGQQLGILRDINTTQYGGTLHLAARRDVIASMTFRTAAYVPTVTYSAAMGYNPYVGVPVTGSTSTPEHNPTLGWKAFGLINNTGIVVGNQDTGETVTRMSFSRVTADPVYAYGLENMVGEQYDALADDGTAAAADERQANVIMTFDAKTGLDLFAHKVEIWFDGRNTELKPAYFGQDVALDWRNSKQLNDLHTYAYFDRASHTSVVKLERDGDDGDENLDTNALSVVSRPANSALNTLFTEATGAGFVVNSSTYVEQNQSFDRFLPVNDADTPTAGNFKTQTIDKTSPAPNSSTDGFDEDLYLLISNSDNKALDVVIALNIQASEITGVDDVNAIKTVTVAQEPTTATFIDDDNRLFPAVREDGTIDQAQLSPDSSTTLGQYVIGVHVDGTSDADTARLPASAVISAGSDRDGNPGHAVNGGVALGYDSPRDAVTGVALLTNANALENAWFKLMPVNNTKVGKVVSYNPDTGRINLQDGTVLERSILYYSVVEGTIPQVAGKGEDIYAVGTYEFYLTPDNKYLGAKLVYDNTFIYGTYMDYSTVTSSSTFNYFLTGVNLAGEKVTVPVSRLNNGGINGTDQPGVPYRDTRNQTGQGFAVNGIGNGVYRGFAYNGTNTINWTFEALDNIGVISGDNNSSNNPDGNRGFEWGTDTDPEDWGPANDATAPSAEPTVVFKDVDKNDADEVAANNSTAIDIGSREMALGAVYAGEICLDGVNVEDLYFTEQTKFILVSGFGEDSLTPTVYNGITELVTKGGHISAEIALNALAPRWADRASASATASDDIRMHQMTYLTQSPFVYSQNKVLSRQADIIILPAAAVDWSDSRTLRYVGNSTRTLVDVNNSATQFTMYNNGVAESIWVNGMISNNNVDANSVNGYESSAYLVATYGDDHFYTIQPSGRTNGSGETIYNVILTNTSWTQNIYTASTMNAQTGSFTATMGDRSTAANATDLMRVDKANITNLNVLNPNPTWPGINSLTTLNYAGSLGDYGVPGEHGGNTDLYVSAITDSSTNVTQIYVCYNQTPAATGTP